MKNSIIGICDFEKPDYSAILISKIKSYEIKSFREQVIQVACSITGGDSEDFKIEQQLNQFLDESWDESNITTFEFIQRLETGLIETLGSRIWIDRLLNQYKPVNWHTKVDFDRLFNATYDVPVFPKWIIKDADTPEKIRAIQEKNGICLKIKYGKTTNELDESLFNISTALMGNVDIDVLILKNILKKL